jgi:hypothetical protein
MRQTGGGILAAALAGLVGGPVAPSDGAYRGRKGGKSAKQFKRCKVRNRMARASRRANRE